MAASLSTALRLEDPARVYLLWGDDHRARKAAQKLIRAAVLDEASGLEAFHHERFEGPYVPSIDRVIAACRQAPLGDGTRLVELDQVDALGAQLSKSGGAKEGIDAVVDYMQNPIASCVLVLTSATLAGTSKLVKAAKKFDPVLEMRFAVADDKGASAQLVSMAKAQGLQIAPRVAAAVIDRVGAASSAWQDALAALAAQQDGGRIQLETVERVLARTRSGDVFALTDAVGRQDAPRALELLGPHFARDERHLEPALKLCAMLAWQLRRLMMVAAKPPRSAGELGLKPFVHQKLSEQARNFSWARLRDLHAGLTRLDRDLKGGSSLGQANPMLLVQHWVLQACGALPGTAPRD